jgi:peroxiredoxin
VQRKASIILAIVAFISMAMISCSKANVPQIGDKAPDFTLESIDGENISLSDFRGKILLIVFTTINCQECERQMPYLIEAYQQANGELEVLDIYHMIYDPKLIRDYITGTQSTTFPALPDMQNKVANAYGATRYPPTTFVVDAEGIIKYKKIGPFQSQKEIEDILKSL